MDITKKIEQTANVAIIVVACLLAVVLVRNYLWIRPSEPSNTSQEQGPAFSSQPDVSSLNVDWKGNKQTLVLAISTNCHFCTESAPFYQTLVKDKKSARVVAVLPQSVSDSKAYLEKLGVSVDVIMQSSLARIGVRGTPTLILVDASGEVKAFWSGKLPHEKETEILSRLEL